MVQIYFFTAPLSILCAQHIFSTPILFFRKQSSMRYCQKASIHALLEHPCVSLISIHRFHISSESLPIQPHLSTSSSSSSSSFSLLLSPFPLPSPLPPSRPLNFSLTARASPSSNSHTYYKDTPAHSNSAPTRHKSSIRPSRFGLSSSCRLGDGRRRFPTIEFPN